MVFVDLLKNMVHEVLIVGGYDRLTFLPAKLVLFGDLGVVAIGTSRAVWLDVVNLAEPVVRCDGGDDRLTFLTTEVGIVEVLTFLTAEIWHQIMLHD